MANANKGARVSHDRAALITKDASTVDSVPRARKLDVPVMPACVTQHTSLAVVGIPSPKFLTLIRDWRVPHVRVGQNAVVELPVLLRFLREHATALDSPVETLEPATAEHRIIEQLGLRRTR